MSSQKAPVSPVIEFIKVLNEMSARYGRSELWYDYIDMHAIALANTCDLRCRDTREEQYNAIVQKYDEKTVQQFAELTAITMTALLENPEQDFLGTVYHNLGLSKSRAGQFFTPYNVGQMMARMNMPDSFVLETFERRTNMFTKELYKITCTRNGETSDIGTYLLKPGPEAPMDCYRNFLNKTDVAVSIKSVPDGFIITDNSEPDTSYHLMFIPMDDDFWARCAAEKETK